MWTNRSRLAFCWLAGQRRLGNFLCGHVCFQASGELAKP